MCKLDNERGKGTTTTISLCPRLSDSTRKSSKSTQRWWLVALDELRCRGTQITILGANSCEILPKWPLPLVSNHFAQLRPCTYVRPGYIYQDDDLFYLCPRCKPKQFAWYAQSGHDSYYLLPREATSILGRRCRPDCVLNIGDAPVGQISASNGETGKRPVVHPAE
jgi:hypothetical protein